MEKLSFNIYLYFIFILIIFNCLSGLSVFLESVLPAASLLYIVPAQGKTLNEKIIALSGTFFESDFLQPGLFFIPKEFHNAEINLSSPFYIKWIQENSGSLNIIPVSNLMQLLNFKSQCALIDYYAITPRHII